MGTVNVRMFGILSNLRDERGLPHNEIVELPDAGVTGRELADMLDIPHSMVEGIFVNHVVHGLDQVVRPGDRVAFAPYGTPGPHRFFLGLFAAGRDDLE
jgi:molybdopterin converting factor small subunit